MARIVPPIYEFNKDELVQPRDLIRREWESARKSRSAEHPVSGDRHFFEIAFVANRRESVGVGFAYEAQPRSF